MAAKNREPKQKRLIILYREPYIQPDPRGTSITSLHFFSPPALKNTLTTNRHGKEKIIQYIAVSPL
jgi:hypothetical protein